MFPPMLHELETEVMEEVWNGGERTVREVLEALNARSTPQRAYTTILTVMQRLHVKELLERERNGRRDVYLPALSREEYAQARAEAEVGALVAEYGDVALAHFARHMSQLDPKRREQIRRLARRD
jgi:predicted transcriptional regulator